MTHTEQISPTRLLPITSLIERVGCSRATVYRWVSAGRFPAPVRLGEARVAWLESDVERWIAERVAERDSTVS